MTSAQEPRSHGERMPFGLADVDIAPGDHIGCFYRGEAARDAVLLPYLRTGMEAGDSCFCFIDTTAPEELRSRLRVEMAEASIPGRLDVHVASEAYLGTGHFSSAHMIQFLESTLRASVEDRTSAALARMTGEMCWVLRSPAAAEEVVAYEHALNDFPPGHRQVLLCLYDIAQFSAAALIEAVRAHPKVLVAGLLADNPWHEPQSRK
jgi:MEDS: MEthanogen/methylotroph, DcmR Sensory domain